jgi:hypothetical protein
MKWKHILIQLQLQWVMNPRCPIKGTKGGTNKHKDCPRTAQKCEKTRVTKDKTRVTPGRRFLWLSNIHKALAWDLALVESPLRLLINLPESQGLIPEAITNRRGSGK